MVYDVVVVGGGPAGLTAGIYARTRSLSTLILEAQAMGGQLAWLYPTKSVYDYPSYIAIEGGELGDLFTMHARESGADALISVHRPRSRLLMKSFFPAAVKDWETEGLWAGVLRRAKSLIF